MIENNLILNRLFTQNVFLGMIQSSASNNTTYGAVIKRFIDEPEDKNNGALISEIYRFMSKSYRNEYFYQNTLLNKALCVNKDLTWRYLTLHCSSVQVLKYTM